MNYLLCCHNESRLPDRFYGDWRTVVFNYATDLANEGKWRNIRRMLLELRQTTPNSMFWCPDPDLEFAPTLPAQLFEAAREYKLDLCQPAVTRDSVCSHPHLFARPHAGPRRVDFCEIMMPLFSISSIRRNLWTFGLNYSGFGIDYLWGKKEPCFVLDWLEVRHPSSPGYHNTARKAGFPDPNRECEEIRRLYL